MSDKITTLHLKNDPSTNIYPNVKIENIPLDVTIAQGGANLATSGTIYEFTTSRFLSLGGGTMNGIITINDIDTPEKTILGDGVEVVEVSNPTNPATHYGSGFIRQDDDEDTSIKYHYNFPKKSGTFALEEDLENYTKKEELNNMWGVVPGQDFTIREQHSFKIGNIIFTHVNGYTTNTGLSTYNYFLKTNKIPTHRHLFGLYDVTGRITAEFTTTGYIMAYAAVAQNRDNIDFEFFYYND